MLEYRTGRPEEADDIIDLANLVFSHDHRPHDFPTLLPKLFKKENFHSEYHYIAVQDGKIRAIIGCYPNEQTVFGHKLLSLDIGTVSVHPYSRREGHMRKLMALLQEDAAAKGADLSWLGGQRQRYAYWGYERIGSCAEFDVTRTNRRHVYGDRKSRFVLKKILPDSAELAQAQALQEAQPVFVKRESFYDSVCNWECTPFAFMTADGAFRGYAILDGNENGSGSVSELILTDESELEEAVLAILDYLSGFRITVFVREESRLRLFADICEGYRVNGHEQCRINSFKRVIEAELAARASMSDAKSLPSCEFKFAVPETNERLRVTWANGEGNVEDLPEGEDAPELTRGQAARALFSPEAYMMRVFPVCAYPLLPLPIELPSPDAV